MHEYHFGTYGNWQTLQNRHDYRLGGVQVGHFRPNNPSIKDQHLALCLSENPDLTFGARGTHATVQLPWPDDVQSVRQINNAPDELFPGSNVAVNPRHMHYITYLTYRVLTSDRPVLEKCCRPVWSSEGLGIDGHVRLHFFGDPFKSLNKSTWKMHIPDAYGSLSDQLFHGGLTLTPNISTRWQFDPSQHKADIPDPEAQDFIPPKLGAGGEGGNCLPPLVLD
jgi:hypothetical protein